MDQYDVVKLKHGDVVIVLQHNMFREFRTRIVAPLVPRSKGKLATSLNPVVRHGQCDWFLATHLLSVVPADAAAERLGSVIDQDYAIKRAVGQLFLGV